MANMTTPKKVQFADHLEYLTPPPTVRGGTIDNEVVDDCPDSLADAALATPSSDLGPPIRPYCQQRQEGSGADHVDDTKNSCAALGEKHAHGHDESDDRKPTVIQNWLNRSSSAEQRKARFSCLLAAIWPSNAEFHAARHPLYDDDNDEGYSYDDWIRYKVNGYNPVDDPNYDPIISPAMSTEVWQPKLGDDGIENQEDLSMVSEMRRQHHAVVQAHAQRRDQIIKAGEKAGVKLGQIDMTRIFLGPQIDSSQDECEGDDNEEADQLVAEPTISTKTIAADNAMTVICKPKASHTSSKAGKSKTKRRRRKSDDDATFRYETSGDDEPRQSRKRIKKTMAAISNRTGGWRAHTRSGSKVGGLDGSDDVDISGQTATMGVGTDTASGTTYYFGVGQFIQEPQSTTEREQENTTHDDGILSRLANMLNFST
ncbi:hypothetical protein GGR57DRAFT_487676 [Xylariaceae sp. FL1272]|nr:hypothetical protein GGR57DRAFT_487676 [Xylariaceae sp. FL1272]